MSRTPNLPPQKKYGSYLVKSDSMGFDSDDGYVPVTFGFAWIREAICDPQTKQISYLVQIEPLVGEGSTIRVEAKDFTNSRLTIILGNHGVIVRVSSEVQRMLAATAVHGTYLEKEPRILIDQPGWFANGKGFYTGNDVVLEQSLQEKAFRFEPVHAAPFAVSGTQGDWWENVGQHIARNLVALGATMVGLSSPYLQQAGLGSRMFCFWGPKGCGKTLIVQCAASVFGNGVDPAAGSYAANVPYVTKFSTTINGIEPLLARYSPMFVALDELTEQQGAFMGELAYKISSGEGKHRMTSHLKSAKANRWQLMVMTTSEKPLEEILAVGGKKIYGGMLDRAIDVPVGAQGIFTDFGDFDSFKALTRHLKAACSQYYGAPGKALLEFTVNNPEVVAQRLAEASEIEERLLPAGCGDGERRVVKSFAVAEAIGKLAVDAGILRCDETVLEAASQTMVDAWWFSRGSALRTVAEYLADHDERIAYEAPSLLSRAKAFVFDDKVVIPEGEFFKEFGPDKGTKLIQELTTLNALLRDTSNANRTKRRFCNNRLWAYVIPMDRILPYLEQVMAMRENEPDAKPDELDASFD